MLGMRTYARAFIDERHSRAEADAAAYQRVAAAAKKHPEDEALSSALEALEAAFFNNLLLTLDYSFIHRLAVVEGKDGNPLNEVRILCNSLLLNKGIMEKWYPWKHVSALGDKSMKLSPESSVLGRQFGEEIKLTEADFSQISEAFFAEMERGFAADS
jgi:hypothetical protein